MSRATFSLLLAIVLAATSGSSAIADELDPVAPSEPTAATNGVSSIGAESVLQPLQRTFFATHPVVRYDLSRSDGLLSSPGHQTTTTIQRASVSLHWNLGDFLSAQYTPTWTFYSGDSFDDNLAHEASVNLERGLGEWNFRGRFRYTRSSNSLVETGRQTTQQYERLSLAAQRPLGYRTTLELGVNNDVRSADNFSGYRQWSTDDWLHYQLSEWVSTSIGVSYGYVDASGPSMSFGQVHGRVRWHVSEKIDLDARAGLERRSFSETGRSDAETPVYGATVSYRPFPTSLFALTGDRVVTPSYFPGEVDRIDVWQATVAQRLFGRVHGELAYVTRTAMRRSSVVQNAPARDDTGHTIKARLSTNFRSNGSIAIYYLDKRNHSSESDFSFDATETGLELTLVF